MVTRYFDEEAIRNLFCAVVIRTGLDYLKGPDKGREGLMAILEGSYLNDNSHGYGRLLAKRIKSIKSDNERKALIAILSATD